MVSIEPLHLFYLEISKKLKACTIAYLKIVRLWSASSRLFHTSEKSEVSKKNSVAEQTVFLELIRRSYMLSNPEIDFTLFQKPFFLNGRFSETFIGRMLEGKHYKYFAMKFLFVSAFIDRDIGYCHHAPATTVHTAYSYFLCSLLLCSFLSKFKKKDVRYYYAETENYVQVQKKFAKHSFGYLEGKNLFKLKFQAVNHVT